MSEPEATQHGRYPQPHGPHASHDEESVVTQILVQRQKDPSGLGRADGTVTVPGDDGALLHGLEVLESPIHHEAVIRFHLVAVPYLENGGKVTGRVL